MEIQLKINGVLKSIDVEVSETLLNVLRSEGYYSVKHGCETGECGTCAVLLKLQAHNDSETSQFTLVNSCMVLAAQVDGAEVTTVESLGDRTQLSLLQQTFIDIGAIQCGYCTPAQLLAAKALLDSNANPSEMQVREALSGVLCRCTGYAKPVKAVLNAAALLRGENPANLTPIIKRVEPAGSAVSDPYAVDRPTESPQQLDPNLFRSTETQTPPLKRFASPTPIIVAPEPVTSVVGKAERKVDAVKLAQGKQAFVDDYPHSGMLYAALLTSPHAHARIRDIRTEKARALPGVHAVLTYKDIKRVIYASGGQSYPNPLPYDQVSLDNKVRHVGDRVAIVAAETLAIARQALELIEVDYQVLPAVFDADQALLPGAPVIHDEKDSIGIKDASRNLVAEVHAQVGDPNQGFAESDLVIEREYHVPQVQPASLEPHICTTWFDEDDRLVVLTSTQVPFHVRRMLAPLIGLSVKRIRVIKPRIGGGFGGKQEMLVEDLCAHLTLATGKPVRFEYTRELEFTSARSRHPQRMVFKAGVKKDGTLRALTQTVVANTGAYGTHGITVQTVSGLRGLSTYRCPNMQYDCQIAYTNIPTPGAYRGYGAPQAEFGLECLMDEVAQHLQMDPIEFRRKNWVQVGDTLPLAKALGEAREGFEQIIKSCALEECHQQGMAAIGWQARDRFRLDPSRPHIRRGIGVATCMHGTAIAGLDMGAASIKMNDDGSFNVLVGGTDLGTGSDTIIGQIVAETLGVPLEDIIMYSSDTDFTPFDKGAYASSTTYITGGAAKKAAEQVQEQIKDVAARMLNKGISSSIRVSSFDSVITKNDVVLRDRQAQAPDGRSISLQQLALFATHQEDQHQIMATASHMSFDSPPPFGAQFAEVEVDLETGELTVNKLVMAVDCGVAINPATASGQIEGGNVQAAGYGVCEEMVYDAQGSLIPRRFSQYHIYQADETPDLQAIIVQTYEPSGPFGAKALAEIPMDGVAPAIVNAVYHATGKRFCQIPLTPERVWRGVHNSP